VAPIVVAAALMPQGGEDADDGGAGSSAIESGGGAGGSEAAAPDSDASVGTLQKDNGAGDASSDGRARRAVQRSASLTLASPRREIDAVSSRIGQVAAQLGGFVAASSVSSNGGGTFELRVPSHRLDTAIQRLSRLARVRELTRESLDITSDRVSARDRLVDARAERKSLLRQLADAVTVNETESIRARLEIVSREISVARRVLLRVNNRANFANVSVTLVPGRAGGDDEGAWTPGDAFDDALRVLEVAAGVALLVAAVALPLALLWLLAWLARRGIARRRRERALDMA
jgi:hypothetical protein